MTALILIVMIVIVIGGTAVASYAASIGRQQPANPEQAEVAVAMARLDARWRTRSAKRAVDRDLGRLEAEALREMGEQ